MATAADRALLTHFTTLDDPRVERTRLHPLLNILTIAIVAVMCGAESWDEIAGFGEARADWFGTFLDLTNGIPSHDTFNRVFAALDPAQFAACFLAWVRAARPALPAQVIALDGKTVRRSHDRHRGTTAIHLVSAWATEQRLVLAQTKVDEGSTEITAIPEVLRALEVQGCLVTIDAMGCQRTIAQQVLDQGGDYVLALKDNQPTLAADVQECFDQAQATQFAGVQHDYQQAVDKGHGRLEIRRRWVITDPEVLAWLQAEHHWPGLAAIGWVQTERRLVDRTTVGTRVYLLSQPLAAQALGEAVRSHWGIENRLHYVRDVTLGEDASHIRTGAAPQVMAALRNGVLAILRSAGAPNIAAALRHNGWQAGSGLRLLGISL